MTHYARAAVLAAALLAPAGPAWAQQATPLSLAPAEPARWDVAGHVGWSGTERSDLGARWDRWSNAVAGGVTIGRYLTPHVKVEAQLFAAGAGLVHAEERIDSPAAPLFPFRPVEHHIRPTTVAAGVSYQFFENQWFHPFVGGGVDVIREWHREVRPPLVFSGRGPDGPLELQSGPPDVTAVTYAARPFVQAGFKWYAAPRAFFRTDVRTAFSTRGATGVAWTTGFGVDL